MIRKEAVRAAGDAAPGLRRWLRSVGYGYINAATGGIVLIVLTPIIIARLGEEAYAVWILAHTLTFYLSFLDLGFGSAQVRYHASFAARDRGVALRKVISTCCVSMLFAGVIAAVLGGVLAAVSPHAWLDLSEELAPEFRLVVALLAVNLLVSFSQAAVENIYEGAQRFDLRNLRAIPVRVLTAGAQLLVLLRGGGIVQLAAVELAASSALLLLDLVLTARVLPGWWREAATFHRRLWRRLRSYALWTSFDEALTEGGAQLNHLLIAFLFPIVLLTPYSLCNTLASVLVLMVAPVIETLFPLASGLHAQRRREDLARLLFAGSKAAIAIGAPIAVFLVFFGKPVLELWVPEAADDVSTWLLTLVVLDHLTSIYLWTATILLFAIGRLRQAVLFTLAEIVAGLAASLWLARFYGLEGLALGSLAANLVIGFGFQLPAIGRALQLPLATLAGSALWRVLIATTPAIVLAAILRGSGSGMTLPFMALAACGIAVFYALSLLLWGLKRGERTLYLDLWRRTHEPCP